MHRDQVGARAESRERIFNRLLPRVAAFHQPDRLFEPFTGEQLAHPRDVFAAKRDHDLAHGRTGDELSNGVQQDWRSVEQHELLAAGAGFLRLHLRHASTEAGGWQYDGDFHFGVKGFIVPLRKRCGTAQSCLVRDEPGAEVCFSYKMSLEGRSPMLGIDRKSGGSRAVEPGADPGLFGGQRRSQI